MTAQQQEKPTIWAELIIYFTDGTKTTFMQAWHQLQAAGSSAVLIVQEMTENRAYIFPWDRIKSVEMTPSVLTTIPRAS